MSLQDRLQDSGGVFKFCECKYDSDENGDGSVESCIDKKVSVAVEIHVE